MKGTSRPEALCARRRTIASRLLRWHDVIVGQRRPGGPGWVKAEEPVSVAPSVSYSITVRLEVPSRGRAVSDLTHAVEQAGGAVTALDVTPYRYERLRVDVTCAARDTDHAEEIVQSMRCLLYTSDAADE